MRSGRKRCLWWGLLSLALFSGYASADWQLDMTPGVTQVSNQVFDMHRIMLYWCVAIGVVVFGLMFYSMVKHRKSKGHEAAQFHESTTVEILWTAIPFLILILMAIPATKLMIAMDDTSDSALTVKVTASRWKWHYEYVDYQGDSDLNLGFLSTSSTPPEEINNPVLQSGLFPTGAAKDSYRPDGDYKAKGKLYNMQVDSPLVIPSGQKVRFLITADDVIHAWWVPDFGIKKDAVPGFINELWVNVPVGQEGIYRGQCAELCGKDHAFMPIVVDVRPQAEFTQWLAQSQEAQRQADVAANQSLTQTFTKEELMAEGEKAYVARCAACHQANGQGLPPMFPALAGSEVAIGPVKTHIDIVNNGINAMPAFGNLLSPKELAAIITYERNAWGNTPTDGVSVVQPKEITEQ